MARTRSKPAPKESPPQDVSSPSTKEMPGTDSNPPKLFVLPKDTSKDARIVSLDNPANGAQSRYFFCPEKGFYEFTRIAAPRKECRSWLITPGARASSNRAIEKEEKEEKGEAKEEEKGDGIQLNSGYTTQSPDLFVATPIDALFLILPALAPKSAKETKQHFLALEDHIDSIEASSKHWKVLLAQYPTLRPMIEKRMMRVCDTVDAGDETMYRLSHSKLLDVLLKKAERMCKNGLPPSMEEKFIKSALDVPVMNVKREEKGNNKDSTKNNDRGDEAKDSTPEMNGTTTTTAAAAPDSQPETTTPSTSTDSQTSTTTTTADTTTTSMTSQPAETPHQQQDSKEDDNEEPDLPTRPSLPTPPEIPHLLRLRTSLTYLHSSYLPPTLHAPLTTLLESSHPRFTPLTTHLAALAALRAEAAAQRSLAGDNISRKRAHEAEEEDERAVEREEKRRKKEEEEKKRKGESRGVKQLRKVDTSGMRKISGFFTKKG